MSWKPVQFDRKEYLELSEEYESQKVDDFESELCEFNEDPEALAAELAYTRYYLAKAGKMLEGIMKILECLIER